MPLSLLPLFRALAIACALLLACSLSAAAQTTGIVGTFAIDPDVVLTDDQVTVTLTIKLANEGEEPVSSVQVSLVPADVEETGDGVGADAFGSFERVSIGGGQSARLRATITVPADEWLRWQTKHGPTFWLSYVDDSAQPAGVRVYLGHVSSIPAGPDAF